MVYRPYIPKTFRDRLIFAILGGTFLILLWALNWRFAGGVDSDNKLEIYFLDVGQGDAILVQKQQTQVLIDGGPDNGSLLQALGQIIPPWDRKIEWLILTHPHADHLGGLNPVIERYQIANFAYFPSVYDTKGYQKFLERVKSEPESRIWQAQAGGVLLEGGFLFQILWPPANYRAENLNNESVVLLLDYNDFEALLLGDAQVEAQANFPSIIPDVEVLKVAHHGSRNGVYEPLLEKARAELAVVSVGAKNRYGHPHASALQMLSRWISVVLRTDQSGTIKVETDGTNFYYKTAR